MPKGFILSEQARIEIEKIFDKMMASHFKKLNDKYTTKKGSYDVGGDYVYLLSIEIEFSRCYAPQIYEVVNNLNNWELNNYIR